MKNNTLTEQTVYEMVGRLYATAYLAEVDLVAQLEDLQHTVTTLKRENAALKEMIESIQRDKSGT